MNSVVTPPADADGWTVEDLDEMPDDGLRYELVDGALLVSPPATNLHDYTAFKLGVVLDAAIAEPWCALTGGGIRFAARNYRAADVMVVRSASLGKKMASPSDVLLAVEVMSPSSVTNDRLVKPAQYAAAGIPYFWRFEIGDVPVLITHTLADDIYREVGRFHDEVVVQDPVSVEFRLRDLLT